MAVFYSGSGPFYHILDLADFTTTVNVYAAAGVWHVGHYGTKRLVFSAATNNLLVKILGSMDGGVTYPIEVVGEFAVNVGTPVIQTVTDLYTHLQVQADPTVNDTHGTLSTQVAGWSRG